MTDYTYLIVGGGMVADSAARGIREVDPDGSIGILSDDSERPYARPALSKKLWTDPEFDWDEKVDLHTEETGAQILLDTAVTDIDRQAKTVTTADGGTFGYEHLLLATGGVPRALPDLPPSDRVLDYRTATDYRRAREFAEAGAHVAVVGGSYIATEVASGLVQNGARVTLVTPDDVLGGSMFPPALAEAFERRFREHDVALRTGVRVTSGNEHADGIELTLDDGSSIEADAVIAGLGIEPSAEIAARAGLATDDGIVVDEYLATEDPSVLAAGDVANYPDRVLGRRRVEHVDNAQQQGGQAGRNLAGAGEPYTHTPMFYSDVFDMGYEAVGQVSTSLDTVEDWQDPTVTGVVYYLDDQKVRGVLLWNVWDKTDAARQVLADADTITPDSLPGRITAD